MIVPSALQVITQVTGLTIKKEGLGFGFFPQLFFPNLHLPWDKENEKKSERNLFVIAEWEGKMLKC